MDWVCLILQRQAMIGPCVASEPPYTDAVTIQQLTILQAIMLLDSYRFIDHVLVMYHGSFALLTSVAFSHPHSLSAITQSLHIEVEGQMSDNRLRILYTALALHTVSILICIS